MTFPSEYITFFKIRMLYDGLRIALNIDIMNLVKGVIK